MVASLQSRVALGPRAGTRVRRVRASPPIGAGSTWPGPDARGGLRPARQLGGGEPLDRRRRKHLCRYLLRPLLADDRLRMLGDGRVPMHCTGLNTIIAVQMALPGKLVTPSKGTRGVLGT